MGRQKISIERIEDKQKRYVTFSKRREGLFKKAETASKMYGIQIGIITFSPAGKPFLFNTSNSSSLDSIIDAYMCSSSSLMLVGDKRKRSSSDGDDDDDDDDPQVHETEIQNHKKQKTMMMDTTVVLRGEEEEEEGFQRNFDSDQTIDQILRRNETMGCGENVKNQRIITGEEELELQAGIAVVDVASTTSTADVDYFDFSALVSPPPPPPVASSSSSSYFSELLVEGDNYCKSPNAELQEIHEDSMSLLPPPPPTPMSTTTAYYHHHHHEYADYHHHHHEDSMSLLPPPPQAPPTPMSTTTTSCNWTSYLNEEEEEEVGGSDNEDYSLTVEEWEHVFNTSPSVVVCDSTSSHLNQEEGEDWLTQLDFLERLRS